MDDILFTTTLSLLFLESTNMPFLNWRAVVEVYLIIIQKAKNFRVNRRCVFSKVFKKKRLNYYECLEAYIVFFRSVSGHRLCFRTAFWDFNAC